MHPTRTNRGSAVESGNGHHRFSALSRFPAAHAINFQTFVDYSLSYDATMDWSLEHHANGTTEAPRLDWIM